MGLSSIKNAYISLLVPTMLMLGYKLKGWTSNKPFKMSEFKLINFNAAVTAGLSIHI